MKTAICIIGTGRCIDHTFDNLKTKVIDAFEDRDVIVYITKGDHSEKTAKIFSALDNVFIHIIKEQPLEITNYSFLENWPPAIPNDLNKGRQVYLQMIKSRSIMNDLIDQTGSKYDRIIFSRMDVIYQESLKESVEALDLSRVWIPHFHHWIGGYNDRFAISDREGMRKYLSLYDYAGNYAEEGHIFHAESTLRHHLLRLGVDVGIFKVRFSRIRNGKPHDDFKSLDNQEARPCDI